METCDLEFKVKPISLIAQLSLEKFSCRVQVRRRRRWVDLDRIRVAQVSVTKGDIAKNLRLFEVQIF